MSINGALQIGRSAIAASQAGIQVAGNNMANAATPGYHRQVAEMVPARPEQIGPGQFIGQGVQIQQIARVVDTALQGRLRDAISDQSAAGIDQRFLSSIETLQNELTDNDLSSQLSAFFNSFSELANNPQDNAVRSVVVQQGVSVTNAISKVKSEYNIVRDEIDRSLSTSVEKVNDILDQVAQLNLQIAETEQGNGVANTLRDQRDVLIDELSQYVDVSAIKQQNGAVDILVGSIPVVLAGQSRGVELRVESEGDQVDVSVRVAADQSTLQVNSGSIGSLLRQREETVQPAIDDLDLFAEQLVFQVNRLHSQGQGKNGFQSVTGTYNLLDTTANLNANAAGSAFEIENGSFLLHVTHSDSGLRETHQINVDGDSMSLDDLVNPINNTVNVPNVTAGTTPDRNLQLTADSGYEISFSEDSSGALAALGVNTFFTGDNATTIGVNETIQQQPAFLAAGLNHVPGSNGTAVAIAGLQDSPVEQLNSKSLREFWQGSVNDLAVRTNAANAAVESTRLVRESLASQVQAVSGVSLDEEAIDLLSFQRQFQAAARFISVIDETLQTLLSIA